MRILHISDTHNHHRQLQDLPAADMIVHSGDFTMAGTESEVMDFMEWMIDVQKGKYSSAYELCKSKTSGLRPALHTSPAYAGSGLSEINDEPQHMARKLKNIIFEV